MAHAGDVSDALREDVAGSALAEQQVFANAPEVDGPFFKVVKVLGEGTGA
jgi:Asp-tRNA(Asn)/Glu-tRNA(Gln) amidotransferase C subunit